MTTTTIVTTVYGDQYRVLAADLANSAKVMLPFYTRQGERWTYTADGERAARRGDATVVHRDNIAGESQVAHSEAPTNRDRLALATTGRKRSAKDPESVCGLPLFEPDLI